MLPSFESVDLARAGRCRDTQPDILRRLVAAGDILCSSRLFRNLNCSACQRPPLAGCHLSHLGHVGVFLVSAVVESLLPPVDTHTRAICA